MSTTIANIRASIIAALDEQKNIYGEDVELNATQNTAVTDALSAELDDLNLNHTYPPTNK